MTKDVFDIQLYLHLWQITEPTSLIAPFQVLLYKGKAVFYTSLSVFINLLYLSHYSFILILHLIE